MLTKMQASPQKNHLLAALRGPVRERIYPRLELVQLPRDKVVCEPGQILRYVYFPTDCILSFLYLMKNGASAEIAVVGNEGLVGVALFTGAERSQGRVVVQSAGGAYRMVGEQFKEEFQQHGEMQAVLLRYTQAVLTQIAQMAACNRYHTLDQQLSRSLLMYLDRLPTNQLKMTQEHLSNMLGVRREGVNSAAAKLQNLGAIRYSRGQITVIDRAKLESECCECYAVVKSETNRLIA
jgi:CRP-like cAMP-binding protein